MISLNQKISLSETGLLPVLVNDYLLQKEAISFLSAYPFSFDGFKKVLSDKASDSVDRKLLVEVLSSQYESISTTNSVTNNIQSLLSDKTFTVVAAHQPCLLMGPLYNIYKIAGAINITVQLKQQYPEYNFVPVFWMGSEDHDVMELNNTYINGRKIEWVTPGMGASGRWSTEGIKKVIDDLQAMGIGEDMMKVLKHGLETFSEFGRFTQYFVNELFQEYGLVVLDQDDARFKHRFASVIRDEIFSNRAEDVLKDNITFLERHYKAQAKPRPINFFYLGQGFRERIVFNPLSQRYEINNQAVTFSREEMKAEIEQHPERFSPNVIFRPLYQEILLPNLAFTGGAGELSYWLELKPLFNYYHVNYPLLVMRSSAVIVNAATQKKLEKLRLSIADFLGDIDVLINRYVMKQMDEESRLLTEKEQVELIFQAISDKAERADVTLKNSVQAEKQKVLATLENLESKMLKAEKRKQETAINQIRAIHAALFPDGILQERRENFLPYYSSQFIKEAVNQLNPFDKSFFIFAHD
ncbi:MAG: bacillithiol biosynthesis cysteine-adding enzyme BshC [Chitinophagales bacterium]